MKKQHFNYCIESYLTLKTEAERIKYLENMSERGEYLPLSLVEDLVCLDLSEFEHLALIKVVNSNDKKALEHFLIKSCSSWKQRVMVTALKAWYRRTDRSMWYKLLLLMKNPMLSQRVRYTILNFAEYTGGKHLINTCLEMGDLDDFSSAFHNMLLYRALQWDVSHPKLIARAESIFENLLDEEQMSNKAVPSALAYLLRYSTDYVRSIVQNEKCSEYWVPIIQSCLNEFDTVASRSTEFSRLVLKYEGEDFIKQFRSHWFNLWHRHNVPQNVIKVVLEKLSKNTELIDKYKISWRDFAGISSQVLNECAHGIKNQKHARVAEDLLGGLIGFSDIDELINEIHANSEDYTLDYSKESSEYLEDESVRNERKMFFDKAFRKLNVALSSTSNSNWAKLSVEWNKPNVDNLDQLSVLARQESFFYQVCFLALMGRFENEDKAALKLLDYIRTDDELVLKYVYRSLRGIGTPRAFQELISAITRTNTNLALQNEIVALLQDADLSLLQSELKSAITDIKLDATVKDERWEIKESLKELLNINKQETVSVDVVQKSEFKNEDIDLALKEKIPHFDAISSEIKRAFRTAEFFNQQAMYSSLSQLDLSPILDMQYKALELMFREYFETQCSNLLHQGVLQRKLDVIGYARPIESQMDNFENYIASQPVINTIAFFSKFKLRKMLRGICQFRPGKRFTLDGLKAFALFFFIFGRKNCNYGLQNLVSTHFTKDEALAAFCKDLHVFQDFRNRAAHEGFRPDSSSDLPGIWKLTANIVKEAVNLKEHLTKHPIESNYNPVARQTNTKEVKVVYKKAT